MIHSPSSSIIYTMAGSMVLHFVDTPGRMTSQRTGPNCHGRLARGEADPRRSMPQAPPWVTSQQRDVCEPCGYRVVTHNHICHVDFQSWHFWRHPTVKNPPAVFDGRSPSVKPEPLPSYELPPTSTIIRGLALLAIGQAKATSLTSLTNHH